ncbi:2OG-Fe(II) oxygenase [Rickettsiales bacterium]|nr:2OG-Fe(II) oxygenase [Rickettsiales bacterium]
MQNAQPEIFNIDKICTQLSENGCAYIDNFLPDRLLRSLYKEIYALDKDFALQAAGIGRGDEHIIRKNIRSDKIHWIEGKTLAQVQLQEKLEEFRFQLNQNLMLGLFDVESHYAVYRKGDFYKRHVDSFKGQKNRIVSMVIYLNKNWKKQDGGLLNLYKDESSKTPFESIVPSWGNMVVFLSEQIPHEVIATHRTRYSIATWFRCNNTNPLI